MKYLFWSSLRETHFCVPGWNTCCFQLFVFLVLQWGLIDKQQMPYATSSPCNQKVGVKRERGKWEKNKWEYKKFGSIRNLYVQRSAEWHIKASQLNYKLHVVNFRIKAFWKLNPILVCCIILKWPWAAKCSCSLSLAPFCIMQVPKPNLQS